MSQSCLACLLPIPEGTDYHPRCLTKLFGVSKVPEIPIELAKLHTLALAMVGHTALSGIQRKVSLGLTGKSSTLQVAVEGARYILKPQSQAYPFLPENEHLTMRLAELVGIDVPPCALVTLQDGSRAYIVKRFDRSQQGTKRHQEDFCQLSQRSPKDKYAGSAEQCAKLVLRYASEPLVESARLFRLLVFTWWTGNGDMHLKNFSLLRGEDGRYRLSPAYDLLCTRLVIPDDTLALSVSGNKKNITARQWMTLASVCELPERAARRVFQELAEAPDDAQKLVQASPLPDDMKSEYVKLLFQRARTMEQVAEGTRVTGRKG